MNTKNLNNKYLKVMTLNDNKMDIKKKRITMRLHTPNPLFERWLTEWRDKARKENSKMEFCFTIALQSLKKYPLPLESGRDCKILKGFGEKLCLMIDNKLKTYHNNKNTVVDTVRGNVQNVNELNKSVGTKRKLVQVHSPSKSKTRSSKEYIPQEGSGSYAILITLYTESLDPMYAGFLTKSEIIKKGQHLSHTSFTKPDPGSKYSAWSSMRTLIRKNLVIKKSNPAKFSLSDEGLPLAKILFRNGNLDSCKDSSSASVQTDSQINNVQDEVVCIDLSEDMTLPPTNGPYVKSSLSIDIECSSVSKLLDTEEKSVSVKKNINSFATPTNSCVSFGGASISSRTCSENSVISSESETVLHSDLNIKSKTKPIDRHVSSSSVASSTQSLSQDECYILPPYTFDIILYVDTCETSGSKALIQDDPILAELQQLRVSYEVKKLQIGDYIWICRDKMSEKELVLPYVVERKRMDDFGQSIKDGRYHEQKFRLKKCGIQNVIYLIERFGNNQHVGLPLSTLYQAATNTAIQDGFCVKFTENIRDTAKYLANFTTILVKMYKSKTLVSCPKENMSEISLKDELISIMTFKEFNHTSSKNKPMKVSDLFIKMLIQIKGMSVDRALAIVNKYPTPALLKKAYDENPGVKGEKLLATLQFGDSSKCIGPTLSKIIHQLFTLKSFN